MRPAWSHTDDRAGLGAIWGNVRRWWALSGDAGGHVGAMSGDAGGHVGAMSGDVGAMCGATLGSLQRLATRSQSPRAPPPSAPPHTPPSEPSLSQPARTCWLPWRFTSKAAKVQISPTRASRTVHLHTKSTIASEHGAAPRASVTGTNTMPRISSSRTLMRSWKSSENCEYTSCVCSLPRQVVG